MTGKLKVDLEPHPGQIAVVRFTGRLDFTSVAEAREQFDGAIASGHRKLIIDLSKVEFVDSAGLGSLIAGMRTARQAGGDLRIAKPSNQAKMLLSLTSLDQVLQVHATIREAIVDFG